MLYGRDAQLEAISGLLDGAREGAGRALVLCGEAGIGKTALLNAARDRAADMRVIASSGLEAEVNLPFGALGEVARPLLGSLDALPGAQADALAAALALTDARRQGGDRFATCAGFLALACAAADERPLLILLDDVQWLDSPSAECLGYTARRLDGARIALLAAARDEPALAPGGSLTELQVTGLGRDDARALLAAQDPELAAAAADAVVGVAGGNPLVLRELPALLSDEQRRGLAAVDPVPVPRNALRTAFEHRLDRLDPPAFLAVTLAASSADGRLDPVARACTELGVAPGALEQAEAAGVVALDGERVTFAHPLLRAVAYDRAGRAERRRCHGALARHSDPDARAWHLAAAALGPDDTAANALEAAGFRALDRGAHSAAADALQRSAQLSVDEGARATRLLTAGLQAALGGDYDRGVALLEPIAEPPDPATRATVMHVLALIRLNGGTARARDNHRTLAAEAERIAPREPAMAASMHADSGVIAVVAGDCALALASAEHAAAALPAQAPPTIACQVHSILGMGLALRGRRREAAAALERAGRLLPEVAPLTPAAQSICFALHARLCSDEPARLREEVLALAAPARAAGSLGLLPYYLLVAADCAYRAGDWDAALAEAAEAVAIADECGQRGPLSIGLVVSGRVRAARGDEPGGRAELARAIEVAGRPGYGAATIWARAALGTVELVCGHADAAIAELEEAERLAAEAGLEDPVIVPWASDLVEAFVRGGRAEDAARAVAGLRTRARRSGVPLALAFAARCDGLTVADAFDDAFARALEQHDGAASPFERARTLLAWGARLHRARRRAEARQRLQEAHDAFAALGAAPWLALAEAELRAAGARRRRPREDPDALTAQELRVAAAAARGAKTREIAAELFLSPKTVEFHLAQIYRKLDVHSRAALATALAALDAAER